MTTPYLPWCPRTLAPSCPEEVFCSHLLKEGRKRMEERERKEMVWWQRRKTCRIRVSWGNRFTVCYSGTSFSMSVNYSGLPGIHTTSPQALACSLSWSQGLPRKDEKKRKEMRWKEWEWCGKKVKEKTRSFRILSAVLASHGQTRLWGAGKLIFSLGT